MFSSVCSSSIVSLIEAARRNCFGVRFSILMWGIRSLIRERVKSHSNSEKWGWAKLVGIWLIVSSGPGAAFRWRMMENQSGGSPVTCNRVLGQFSANHTRKREHLVVGM
jgi:hypothetical protein